MTVNQTLRKHHLNVSSSIQLIQDVRTFVEKRGRVGAAKLISELTGATPAIPTDNKKAIHFTQAVIEGIYKDNNAKAEVLFENAKIRIEQLATDPRYTWMYAEKEEANITKQQVSQEVDVMVAVHEDGTIKKGGRAVLAEELYNKYVINGTEQTTRAAMIELFVKEIGMTPAGASTYFANAKAKFGDPKNLIVAAKKGRK